jgi:hypothetical protein
MTLRFSPQFKIYEVIATMIDLYIRKLPPQFVRNRDDLQQRRYPDPRDQKQEAGALVPNSSHRDRRNPS